MVHFHQGDMQNVDSHQGINGVVFDNITDQEVTHSAEINQEENRVSHGNPPIDSSLLVSQRIEIALYNQSIKSTLLYRSLNTNIGYSHEYTVHHDETLSGRVGESKQCGVHSI